MTMPLADLRQSFAVEGQAKGNDVVQRPLLGIAPGHSRSRPTLRHLKSMAGFVSVEGKDAALFDNLHAVHVNVPYGPIGGRIY